ncbi:MAG: TonB family protein [Terriglobales bacterium]
MAADLALDLILNEIGERARADSKATAAAIALERDGEIVCRATTGDNAPDLGVPLNLHSGLSAACVQTRNWQHCQDTELDERVDPEVCRRLGVRSILVFPIVKKQELLGIIEIFGSRAHAFSSREIAILEALAREVVENVDRAAAVQSTPAPESIPEVGLESLQASVPPAKERDFWNDALSLMVIALALILGWVVGRAGWRSTMTGSDARRRSVSQSGGVARPSAASSDSPKAHEESAGTPSAGEESSTAAAPENGLTVYKNGKVVFRSPTQTRNGAVTAGPPPSAAGGDNIATPRLRIPAEIANEYVVRRVEPEYPEHAREQRIQGPVVIDVMVGKNGEVEKLASVRGDAQLVAAASSAIRQWRFQPFFRNGQPEAFQTRVTLDFRLP